VADQNEMNTSLALPVERCMRFMPCTVQPSDSVAHARALLEERHITHLPVVSKERLVGIVSTHDLRAHALSSKHRALAKALEVHPDRVKVNSVMTAEVRTVTPSDNLEHAAELMLREHIGALPVVEQGRLAGIINRTDLPKPSSGTALERTAPSRKHKSGKDTRNRKSAWPVSAANSRMQVRCLWMLHAS
jgi:CBS domain-containing protein